MNKKISLSLIPLGAVLSLVGCHNKTNYSHSISWKGNHDTYTPSYSLYEHETIQLSNTLTSYFNNPNFKEMWCQDILDKANVIWQFQSTFVFKYFVGLIKVDTNKFVMSYDIKINDENGAHRLEMNVKNLPYVACYYEENNSNTLYFAPENTWYDGDIVYIDDDFWLNASFEIDIKKWSFDGKLETNFIVNFNFLNPEDQMQFQFDFAPYLIFSPFYFSKTSITK